MDFEDKWKKNIGADLYKEKPNMLAVDAQLRQMIIHSTTEENISI